MAEKKKKKIGLNTKNIVIFLLMIALVVGYYVSVSRRTTGIEKTKDEYTLLVDKDFEYEYPATPKEVVKLYARYVKCIYKDSLKESQIEKLVKQLRNLFDDELLAKNTLESQLKLLKRDIEDYKSENKSIINYEVDEESIQTATIDGAENTTIIIRFSLKKDSDYLSTYEKFLLRKDKDKKWKIVGWHLVDSTTDAKTATD
ncbi:MAG: hypothetical protein IKL07_02100 [Clostridium sp.]|nr:hypothetical protein [Clostridium sp.]